MKKLMMALLAGTLALAFGAQAADKDMKEDAPKAEAKKGGDAKGEGKKAPRAPKAAKG